MNKIETRILKSEVRASQGDEMALMGRAVAYGSLSAPIQNFRERVQRGAFEKSLANKSQNVIADFNHQDNAIPLGTTKAGTLILKDGPDGLDFRCVLDPNNSEHRNLYSSVKRGDLSEMSWAFNIDGPDGEDWDTDTDDNGNRFNRRTVKRAILHGISVVCHPAYPGVTSVAARSLTLENLQQNPKLSRSDIERFCDQGVAIARGMGSDRPAAMFTASLRTGIPLTQLIDCELRMKVEATGKIICTSGPWEE
jgi:HK97 family phage prohead protease